MKTYHSAEGKITSKTISKLFVKAKVNKKLRTMSKAPDNLHVDAEIIKFLVLEIG